MSKLLTSTLQFKFLFIYFLLDLGVSQDLKVEESLLS